MRKSTRFGFLLTIIALIGCASAPEPTKTGEVYDAYESDPNEQAAVDLNEQNREFGPQPIRRYPVVLVLGPGHARTYAAAGVIRALADANIPVGAVLGSGMGALFAGVYAGTDTVNQFEWVLQKIKPDFFKPSGIGSLLGQESSGSDLEGVLQKNLGNEDIGNSRMTLRLGAFSEATDRFFMMSSGPIAEGIRVAVSEPGLLKSKEWENGMAHSASSAKPYLVEEAKALGIGPVVVVDVLDRRPRTSIRGKKYQISYYRRMLRARQSSQETLLQADLVLRPTVYDLGYFDFGKKSTAIFRGKKVVRQNLGRIRRLVGIQPLADGGR